MQYIVIMLVSSTMLISIWQYVTFQYRQKAHRLRISFELFYTLIIIYTLVIIGFAIIYFMLSLYGEVLVDTGQIYPVSISTSLFGSIYFISLTVLKFGYGDVMHIGAVTFIAVILYI